ncbi:CbiX/SirB N-terminal domain-containing protein [Robbsia sp. Bb-Pol-6]|uniref:CbiX/SirB N-terminal domain-containing protein n=1 Tax=Robbsia betulipollinis TaxID=2981849 RepID=A0ABT3ZLQ7_9BURK|nr:CbiX/SirB N-terminal domain-containing protein [Robbsia betulipollinis]MCY0387436.1 CbiX/SirB N-terminal domain-containing protein [Robbsia betulipollinis]
MSDANVLPPSATPLRGLILFGHGARDPRWAEPFERLAQQMRARQAAVRADDGAAGSPGAGPVSLAFLELMTPDLATAVGEQVSAGCDVITVVPVFFGRGAHLRRDFPALLDACRASHPDITIRSAEAVGEDESVLQAVGAYALQQWQE